MTEMVDRPAVSEVSRRLGENLSTMMFRVGRNRQQLAAMAGITKATFSRKLNGVGDWSLTEVAALAEALDVELAELVGVLPSYEDWMEKRACRDSNPKPSDP